jgi:hypothetical protein
MNYSETINELFDPLLDMTLKESKQYLKDNEKSIKDDVFAAIVLFLGISKPIYKKTGITIYKTTLKNINKQFLENQTDLKITQKMLGKIKKRNQYIFTNAKEFNQQVLKQEHLIKRYNKDEEIQLLWYVLNEKTSNHCEFCLANNEVKIYVKGEEPKLPQEEGHGGVGYGCYCYYLPIRTKDDLKTYSKLDEDREFIKDWWKDSYLKRYFDDDLTNGDLP